MERDISNHQLLLDKGWRVLTIWECALTGKWKLELHKLIEITSDWLLSMNSTCEIAGEAVDSKLNFTEKSNHDPSDK